MLNGHSQKDENGFQDQLSFNAGQKYCRMLQGEHSAILSTFIKLLFFIKIIVLSILEWLFKQVLLYICFSLIDSAPPSRGLYAGTFVSGLNSKLHRNLAVVFLFWIPTTQSFTVV